MEEKKSFDLNSLIGFLLIGGIIMYMMYNSQQKRALEQAENPVEVVDQTPVSPTTAPAEITPQAPVELDSVALAQRAGQLGAFGYSAALPSAKDEVTTVENELLQLKVSNKGGQIIEAKLKQVFDHDSLPIYLVKDDNSSFGLEFFTGDNKIFNTRDLYFQPQVTQSGENTTLSMKLKSSENQYLEYVYTLKPNDYMMDFTIRSQGLNGVLHPSQPIKMDWSMKTFFTGKSIDFENRYTEAVWHYQKKKNDSRIRDGEEEDKEISWMAYRQHFFSSILLNDIPFEKGTIKSQDLQKEKDTVFTKEFASVFPLKLKGGELQENMNLYYGPSDIKILEKYDRDLDEVIPMGWGIFGWINKYIFIPLLNYFMKFLPAGLAIILMTVIVKLLLSPVQYKQYLSQAKQRVLRPEIEEINKRLEGKENQMKRQQEIMALNRKAGINPASGCLVGLVQIPIFYALFRLFPSAFNLRHKSFLWAEDLSSFDVIANLPFTIPMYGNHVSLFPLLASVAIFFYMLLTTSGQTMPKQPGMPDMRFIMYLSPIFMLVFFNMYPSGLSVYYLTSNVISIGIVLVIKKFILDEEKIHNQIQENKKKPVKQNRFQRKMSEMMEQAEHQQKLKGR